MQGQDRKKSTQELSTNNYTTQNYQEREHKVLMEFNKKGYIFGTHIYKRCVDILIKQVLQ
jgi:hypothetical protein